MLIRVLRVKTYTQNMAIVGDFDQTEALHATTNTCHNSVRPDFIHHPGCVINRKISLSMVKWVSHGPLTLSLRQCSSYLFLFLLF